MARFARIGGSFAIVLVAYWAYALVAVPLIEPPPDRHGSGVPSAEEVQEWVKKSQQRWREEFKDLFPPDAWELKDPKVLEVDKVKLLLEDYTTTQGGKKVKIQPFTMILTPDASAGDAEQRRRRAVVLQAPEGAILEFDQPFDLRRARVGRLLGGQLNGEITIRSQGKSPGPDDDLEVVTRDVTMSEEEIRTEQEVDFRLGSSYGRGRGMTIKLVPGPKEEAAQKHGPNVEGIEFIEIDQLDRVHLQLDDQGIVPDGPGKASGEQGANKSEAASELPIEITCRGPFRFDPIQQVATFKDQVDVIRLHRDGPSDQLNNCETLSIHFARPRDALGAPGDDESRPSDLKRQWELYPRRITAWGTSMAVRAPSQQIDAEGELLNYDFETGWIRLEGTQGAFLRQGENEIHARWIQYQLTENKRLGQAKAAGPGRIRARLGDEGEQQLFARWGQMLQLRPYQGQPVISLTGGAELEFGDLGKLTAPEIHFYLFELPPEKPDEQVRVRPDRMVALTYPVDAAGQTVLDDTRPARAVQLHSPQVTATVEQLRVWFEQRSAQTDDQGPSAGDRGPRQAPAGPAGPAESSPASLLSLGGQETGDQPEHHFTIDGRLLQARVLVPDDVRARDEKSELAELTIEEGVELIETRCDEPGEPPVVVRGDLIRVRRASRPSRWVKVAGTPPRFEGRGLELSGADGAASSIELDSATNELKIEKPGWMELPLDRDFEGRPLPRPGRLHIVWQKRMTFDGDTVRFEGEVVATGRHQKEETELHTALHTAALDVSLVRRILFADLDRKPDRPDLKRIICYGGVFMENRSWDPSGLLSLDRMWVANLDVDMISGQSTAGGPGRIISVHRPELLASRTNDGRTVQAADSNREDDDQLRYLNVRFQGSIEGNVHHSEMTFYDEVNTVYGPVDSWDATLDPDDPESLGPKGMIVACDRLEVAHMPQPLGGRAMELAASGNVEAQGRTFTARAPLITYNHAKELLILDGEGRLAELYHQKREGAPLKQTSAEKISYWIATGEATGGIHWMTSN